jgi:hypothetical protein
MCKVLQYCIDEVERVMMSEKEEEGTEEETNMR